MTAQGAFYTAHQKTKAVESGTTLCGRISATNWDFSKNRL